MTQKQEPEVLEGFTFELQDERWHCIVADCGKEYAYRQSAVSHREKKHSAMANNETPEPAIEGFVWDGYTYHCEQCYKTYVNAGVAIAHRETKHNGTEVVDFQGGDVLRAIVTDLRAGKFDLPDLISKLELTAGIVDGLINDLRKVNVRELQKKAEAWDLVVNALENNGITVAVLGAAK